MSLRRTPERIKPEEIAVKTIGLLGGMSWELSIEYYRMVNEQVKDRIGGLHSARCVLYSVDFAEIERLQHRGDWDTAADVLAQAARQLEQAGAEFLVLCTNTMHRVAPTIQERITIPLLHIADPTAEAITRANMRTVGLLGTRFTMEQDFYKGRLVDRYQLNVLIPSQPDREIIHRIIYEELCLGQILPASRDAYRAVIDRLIDAGAEGIILGCTEIDLLIGEQDSRVPLFDTTRLHAAAAVAYALAEREANVHS
jgi:aspartate racemase